MTYDKLPTYDKLDLTSYGYCINCGLNKPLRRGICQDCPQTSERNKTCGKGGLGQYDHSSHHCTTRCEYRINCQSKLEEITRTFLLRMKSQPKRTRPTRRRH